jgi:nucleoside 2-deoxyribosyltransferase
MRPRLYLAGPDVFLPDPYARGRAMKEICDRHALEGVFPMDPHPDPAQWAELPEPYRIQLRCEAQMRSCDILVANLTPFRGPSADVGTAFEVGFMRALGRPVFGWAATGSRFTERTLAFLGTVLNGEDGRIRDQAGMLVETFDCFDNLMLDGGIAASGGVLVAEEGDELAVFERCIREVAARLGGV